MFIKFTDQKRTTNSIVINSDNIYLIREINQWDTEIELDNGKIVHVWEDVDEVLKELAYCERLKSRPSQQYNR